MMMTDPRALSPQQQALLRYCWGQILAVLAHGSADARRDLGALGVPWHATSRNTPARRAALSRALRRLHRRGLLVRRSATGRGRTTHVMLTGDGIDLAKRLTSDRPKSRWLTSDHSQGL